jgi:hypothetical protein
MEAIQKIIHARWVNLFVCICFVMTSMPVAQAAVLPYMPEPNQRIMASQGYDLPLLKGIIFSADSPFYFTFLIKRGNIEREETIVRSEVNTLSKYFLAALTLPGDDLWVNLSPYERDRISTDNLALTDLGKDMLGEDYVLKQFVASITYPEEGPGKTFWNAVYKKLQEKLGTSNVPVDTFNKVWIMPDKIKIVEGKDRAMIESARLKVMMEDDYLAISKNKNKSSSADAYADRRIKDISNQVMRQEILPLIEKEINEGKHFAHLRQIYHSIIMANWFKEKLKNTILNDVYFDKSKLKGADVNDPAVREKIYNSYTQAFREGVYNYIKTDQDSGNRFRKIRRKYVSGGEVLTPEAINAVKTVDLSDVAARRATDAATTGAGFILDQVRVDGVGPDNQLFAMPKEAAPGDGRGHDNDFAEATIEQRAMAVSPSIKGKLTGGQAAISAQALQWTHQIVNDDGTGDIGEAGSDGSFRNGTYTARTIAAKRVVAISGKISPFRQDGSRKTTDEILGEAGIDTTMSDAAIDRAAKEFAPDGAIFTSPEVTQLMRAGILGNKPGENVPQVQKGTPIQRLATMTAATPAGQVSAPNTAPAMSAVSTPADDVGLTFSDPSGLDDYLKKRRLTGNAALDDQIRAAVRDQFNAVQNQNNELRDAGAQSAQLAVFTADSVTAIANEVSAKNAEAGQMGSGTVLRDALVAQNRVLEDVVAVVQEQGYEAARAYLKGLPDSPAKRQILDNDPFFVADANRLAQTDEQKKQAVIQVMQRRIATPAQLALAGSAGKSGSGSVGQAGAAGMANGKLAVTTSSEGVNREKLGVAVDAFDKGGLDFARADAEVALKDGGLKFSTDKAMAYLEGGKVAGLKLATLKLTY